MSVGYASREATALALASVEDDDDLRNAVLNQYKFAGPELVFVLTLAQLVAFERDADELREILFRLACTQAVQG